MLRNFFFTNHRLFYLIVFSFFLHVIAAYFSQGYYEQDEHFSILEPIMFKLGEEATLGWDFFLYYDKQWFLSFTFFYIIQFLQLFGIDNPFQWAFIIRLVSSILGWISIICLIHFTKKQLGNEKNINTLILISTLFWFYPFIHARAASESISISFLIIAITLFTFFYKNKKTLLFCGVCLGLAFVTRYTNIVIILSFGIWALIFRKVNFINSLILITSFCFVYVASIFIDYWGYGTLFPGEKGLVAYNYFYWNQVWHGMYYFGRHTDYWWYNFYLIITEFFPPISIIILICILIFWIRNPLNIITWITLPYFVFLSINPFKETRFLFPILMISPFFVLMVLSDFYLHGKDLLKNILSYKILKFFTYLLVVINCLALLILSMLPANSSIPLFKFLYSNEFEIKKIYTIDKIPYRKSDLLINFYRNKDIYFTKITDREECDKIGNERGKEIEVAEEVNLYSNYSGNEIEVSQDEIPILEIQKYSKPNWIYKYSIQCNKNLFFENFKLDKTKYFLIHKFSYYDFFAKNQEYNCNIIFSTFPKWLLNKNTKKIHKNLPSGIFLNVE